MAPRVPLIFGTMTIGEPGKNGVRTSDLGEAQKILDVFFAHGHKELDTARMYAEGTTESHFAKLDIKGSAIDTKVHPDKPGDHKPENLRAIFKTSLEKLGPHKPRILYLHFPDRTVPFEDTLREINNLHKEGLFQEFGLSNYAAWEVSEIVGICKANQWVMPTVYQAMYNAITRAIEDELVPCLRKNGIRLVVYNPLAGGFFAGRVASVDDIATEGRFAGDSQMAKLYRGRYIKAYYFDALQGLKQVAEKNGLRLTEVAVRWCQHHSVLGPNDGIILGASSPEQLEQNCVDAEKGPLPQEILDALDAAWVRVGFNCPKYWR